MLTKTGCGITKRKSATGNAEPLSVREPKALLDEATLKRLALKFGEGAFRLELQTPEGIDAADIESRYREWVRQERIALAGDKALRENPEYQKLERYCRENGLDIRVVAADILTLRRKWNRILREHRRKFARDRKELLEFAGVSVSEPYGDEEKERQNSNRPGYWLSRKILLLGDRIAGWDDLASGREREAEVQFYEWSSKNVDFSGLTEEQRSKLGREQPV